MPSLSHRHHEVLFTFAALTNNDAPYPQQAAAIVGSRDRFIVRKRSRKNMPLIISPPLLVADLRLGGTLCARLQVCRAPVLSSCLSEPSRQLSLHRSTFALANSSHRRSCTDTR